MALGNLTLLGSVFASAALVWAGQAYSLHRTRTHNRDLQTQLAAARSALASVSEADTDTADALSRAAASSSTGQSGRASVEPVPAGPLNPALEGAWPSNRPYFYLSKRHLRELGFALFAPDARLTPTAARVFGLSSAERAAVDQAYQRFLDRVHALQSSQAERVAPRTPDEPGRHVEIVFRLAPAGDRMDPLRGDFAASIHQALGDTRAALVLAHAEDYLNEAYGRYGANGYRVAYVADRAADGTVTHQLVCERDLPAPGMFSVPVTFPLDPASPLRAYRHLFGEQPLLPLPVAAAEAAGR